MLAPPTPQQYQAKGPNRTPKIDYAHVSLHGVGKAKNCDFILSGIGRPCLWVLEGASGASSPAPHSRGGQQGGAEDCPG